MSKLFAGRTLHQIMDEGKPFPPEQILPIAIELANVLDTAHKHGKVFGGLFPDQILFDDGSVQLFELAAPRLPEDLTLSYLSFVPPEKLEGQESTPQSDIYSVGIALYVMLTGKLPFAGEDREEVVQKILQTKLEPVTLPPGFGQLDWIIKKCLIRIPARRFSSAHELAVELRKIGKPARAASPMAAPPPPRVLLKRKSRQLTGWVMDNWKLVVGILASLIMIFLAWIFFRSEFPEPVKKSWSVDPIPPDSDVEKDGVFSPDGSLIAFVSNPTGNWEIFLRSGPKGKPQQLTTSPGFEENPRWSPDGKLILYTYLGPGIPPTLFAVSPDGGIPLKMADNATEGEWSPDGKFLCFISPATGKNRSLYILEIENGDKKVLLENHPGIGFPSFSHDGKQIVVEADVEGGHGLMIVDVESRETEVLSNQGDHYPVWNWKNGLIYFASTRNGDLDLYRRNRDDFLEQITRGKGNDIKPVPSTDGNQVLFTRQKMKTDLMSVDPEKGISRHESPAEGISSYPRSVGEGKSLLYLEETNDHFELKWLSSQGLASTTLEKDLTEDVQFAVSSDRSAVLLEEPTKGLIQVGLKVPGTSFIGRNHVLPYIHSPDKKLLFYGLQQGTNVSYMLRSEKEGTEEELMSLPLSGRILRAFWVDHGNSIVYSTRDRKLILYSLKENQQTELLNDCLDVSLHPDQTRMAILAGTDYKSASLITFDLKSRRRMPLTQFTAEGFAKNIDWARDGSRIYYDRFKTGDHLCIAE